MKREMRSYLVHRIEAAAKMVEKMREEKNRQEFLIHSARGEILLNFFDSFLDRKDEDAVKEYCYCRNLFADARWAMFRD